jgi:hypothetical protein
MKPPQKQMEDPDPDLPPLQKSLNNPANAQLARQNSQELAPEHQVPSAPGQGGQQVAPNDDGRHGAPAVRLDMNLDVDIQLKAKIKGDITLYMNLDVDIQLKAKIKGDITLSIL